MKILLSFLLFIITSIPAWAQFNVGTSIQPFKYAYISYASSSLVKSGRGFLHNITFEGGTAGFITIYDVGTVASMSASNPTVQTGMSSNTISGTVIGNFDATASLFTYTYDIGFASGCTIVTNSPTKMTVSYL